MKRFKALVLDWDGVFHDGRKAVDGSSTFTYEGVPMQMTYYFEKRYR